MDRVIFVKHDSGRKSEYSIRTVARQKESKVVFEKVPMSDKSRKQHLVKLIDAFHLLEKSGISQRFAPPVDSQGAVTFDKVEGLSFEDRLLDSLLKGNEKDAGRILDEFTEFLSQLSRKYDNKGLVQGLAEVINQYFSDARVIDPGFIDITFDNTIQGKHGPVVIDYEWVLDGPIPINYLLYRSIMAFSIKYTELLRLLSGKIEVSSLGTRLLLPSFMFKKYGDLTEKIQLCLEVEYEHFQPMVTGAEPEKWEKLISPAPYKERSKFYIAELEKALWEKERAIEEKERAIEGCEQMVLQERRISVVHKEREQELRGALEGVLHSKSYKAGRLVTAPFRAIRKFIRRR